MQVVSSNPYLFGVILVPSLNRLLTDSSWQNSRPVHVILVNVVIFGIEPCFY